MRRPPVRSGAVRRPYGGRAIQNRRAPGSRLLPASGQYDALVPGLDLAQDAGAFAVFPEHPHRFAPGVRSGFVRRSTAHETNSKHKFFQVVSASDVPVFCP